MPLTPKAETPCPPGAPVRGHGTVSVSSRTLPVAPVDVPRRALHMQRAGKHTVPQCHHRLDDAAHSGCRLRVTEVRLQRPHPQGAFGAPLLTVRVQQGLCLDGVAQPGTGAVRLHRIDLAGLQPGVGQRAADDSLLGGSIGHGQTAAGTVLIHRRTPHDGEDPMPLAYRVRQPLHHQDADALGPARTVRRVVERLAAPVRGEPPLPGELHVGGRVGEHGDSARQGELALLAAQRLHRQVQCHE
ncbi:hypothetical protein GCM10020254_15250 [Streptomyces goshikiensis]